MSNSGVNIVPLDTWAKEHLTALVTAKSQQNFDKAFDGFISKSARITFDGEPMTRDEYRKRLRGEDFLERYATVDIQNIVEAPKSNVPLSYENGMIGMFYMATVVERNQVEGAPTEHKYRSTLNAHIANDDVLPLPPGGGLDNRRVMSLDQVLMDIPPPL